MSVSIRQIFASVFLAFVLSALHLPVAYATDVTLDEIIAVVNEGIVLRSEVDAEIRFLQQQAASNNQRLSVDNTFRQRVVDRLIDQQLQQQRAAQLGIEIDPASINNAIDRIASANNLSTVDFRGTLQQQGFDYDHFRDSIRRELLLDRLIQKDVAQAITLSDQEIDDYLAADTVASNQNQRYRLQHILFAVPSTAPPSEIAAAKAKAESALQSLQQGADFANLAVKVSDGRRALSGGDLGWRKIGELPAFLHASVSELETGEVSDIIQSQDGFHILRLADKEQQQAELTTETRARHIFIEQGERRSQSAAVDLINQAGNQLLDGEDFEEVARSMSEDPNSASSGGYLPWFATGEMPSALEQAANALTPGQISEPVQTQYGWHIVEVLERRTHDRSSARLRREAELNLRQRKLEQETERWARRLRSEAFVEIR